MIVLETERLRLRWLTAADAPFMLRLLNEPSFHQYIGDRGVRTEEQARTYIEDGSVASYRQHGFGMYLTSLLDTDAPVGICGLVKREGLDDVDIGFAFVPEYWRRGFAVESAQAVLDHAWNDFHLPRVVGITADDNIGSVKVLERIGLRFESMVRLPDDKEEIRLYAIDRP